MPQGDTNNMETYRGHTITTKRHAVGFIATATGPSLEQPVSRTGGSLVVRSEVRRIIDRNLAQS